MTDEIKPETLDTYESLFASLAKNEKQEQLLYWLYQELGKRVSEKVLAADPDDNNFQHYDVVGVSLEEIVEEFKMSGDYEYMKDVFKNQEETLYRFLKLGYGTPEEVFRDFA